MSITKTIREDLEHYTKGTKLNDIPQEFQDNHRKIAIAIRERYRAGEPIEDLVWDYQLYSRRTVLRMLGYSAKEQYVSPDDTR